MFPESVVMIADSGNCSSCRYAGWAGEQDGSVCTNRSHPGTGLLLGRAGPDQVVVEGEHDGGCPVTQLQLAEDVVDMGLDRAFANIQSGGDLGVGLALADEGQHLPLAGG